MLETTPEQRERQLAEVQAYWATYGAQPVLVAMEPGDATHYEVILAPLAPVRRFAPESGYVITERDRWLMADPENGRAMTVDLGPGHYTDPHYVEEKWARGQMWTACILAEMLNTLTGVDAATLDGMRAAHPDVFG